MQSPLSLSLSLSHAYRQSPHPRAPCGLVQERDAWKAEAERARTEAKKLKDRLEEMAYKVNGLAAGAL